MSDLVRSFKIQASHPTKKIRKTRKAQVYISNALRLEILIMITQFGLSCYQAARVLKVPYTNAKVIYRVYREEKRVFSNSRSKKLEQGSMGEAYLLEHAYIMR